MKPLRKSAPFGPVKGTKPTSGLDSISSGKPAPLEGEPKDTVSALVVHENYQDRNGDFHPAWQDKTVVFDSKEAPATTPDLKPGTLGGVEVEQTRGKIWNSDGAYHFVPGDSNQASFSVEVVEGKLGVLRANVPRSVALQTLEQIPEDAPIRGLLNQYLSPEETVKGQPTNEASTSRLPEREQGAAYVDENFVRHEHWVRKVVEFPPGEEPTNPLPHLKPGESAPLGEHLRLTMNGHGSAVFLQEVDGKTEVSTLVGEGKVQAIHSLASAEDMAVMLDQAPSDHPMTQLLREHLTPPKPTTEMQLQRAARVADYVAIQQDADKLKGRTGRHLLNRSDGSLEMTNQPREKRAPEKSQSVSQGQFGVAREGLLHTTGLGPCVGLTLYDPENRVGLLAHTDAGKDVDASLARMLKEMERSGADLSRLEARVIGGQSGAERPVAQLLNGLKKRKVPVAELDILGKGTRNIGLDLETGRSFDYDSVNDAGGMDFRTSQAVSNLTFFTTVMTANGGNFGPLGAALIAGATGVTPEAGALSPRS